MFDVMLHVIGEWGCAGAVTLLRCVRNANIGGVTQVQPMEGVDPNCANFGLVSMLCNLHVDMQRGPVNARMRVRDPYVRLSLHGLEVFQCSPSVID